jgi:glycosyltransferase involved in cell wall biosynthesis
LAKPKLAVVVSHPIQHFVPGYASWSSRGLWDQQVFFASSIGARPYFDPGFGKTVQWEGLDLSSFSHRFLNRGEAVPVNNALDAPDLEGALAEYAPDALLVYGYVQRLQRRAAAWAHRRGAKLLFIADSEHHHRPPFWKEMIKRPVLGRYLARVDAFLTVGDANEQVYRGYGVGDDRLARTGFTIDLPLYRAAWEQRDELRARTRDRLGLQEDEIALPVVGKLVAYKSQEHLLEALERLSDAPGRYAALIIGTGEDDARLRARASRLVRHRAIFTGFVQPTDLPGHYAAGDVYVHPARSEPHSLAISEAISMGLPVVLSDRCGSYGPADDVQPGRNGFVHAWGDASSLASCIRRLAEDGELREKFAAASREISRRAQVLAHGGGVEAALRIVGLL